MRFPLKLKSDVEFDVLGFGTNAVDYLIQVPEYPTFDSKVELSDYLQLAGGEIATAMVGLQRLGLKTCYVGRFGKDSAGDFGLESLRNEGLDVSFAEQLDGAKTQIAFIVIDERNGERTVIWKRDKKLGYNANEAPFRIAANSKIIHFTPHDTAACIELARVGREAGAIVSIDIDNVFDGIEELLPLVDVLIASSDFPKKLFGTDNHKEALIKLKEKYGCAVSGLTLGEEGSIIFCENEFIETNGFEVPNGCKDTTGAGDSFRAGFLYGIVAEEDLEECARIANAVAALKCREVGARTALPNLEELRDMLNA